MEKKEPSMGELFSELKLETRTLIKQEMDLLRVELTSKALQGAKDAGALGIGAILLHTGLLTLMAAAILGLAVCLPPWLSALLVAILLLIAGGILVQAGRKDLARLRLAPDKSRETIKETAKWAKSAMK